MCVWASNRATPGNPASSGSPSGIRSRSAAGAARVHLDAVRRAYGITQARFESIWQSRTRRRYGGLAVFADLSIAAALMAFFVLPVHRPGATSRGCCS